KTREQRSASERQALARQGGANRIDNPRRIILILSASREIARRKRDEDAAPPAIRRECVRALAEMRFCDVAKKGSLAHSARTLHPHRATFPGRRENLRARVRGSVVSGERQWQKGTRCLYGRANTLKIEIDDPELGYSKVAERKSSNPEHPSAPSVVRGEPP